MAQLAPKLAPRAGNMRRLMNEAPGTVTTSSAIVTNGGPPKVASTVGTASPAKVNTTSSAEPVFDTVTSTSELSIAPVPGSVTGTVAFDVVAATRAVAMSTGIKKAERRTSCIGASLGYGDHPPAVSGCQGLEVPDRSGDSGQ